MKTHTPSSGFIPLVQRMDYLRKVEIFAELEPEALLMLAKAAEPVSFTAGQALFREHSPADAVYFLVAGRVEIERAGGHREILKPGESFGVFAVLADRPRLFTARAISEVQCLRLKRESFQALLEDHPRFYRAIVNGLVEMIDRLTLSRPE